MDFSYTLTDSNAPKAALGLIVLQSDETIETDLRRMFPHDATRVYVSRVGSEQEVTTDTLAGMEARLPSAASMFPAPVRFDAVGYGCTSGTSVIGAKRVAELVSGSCDTRHVTEPVSALIAACCHLGVSKIAFLSPYVAEVSNHLRAVLKESGVSTSAFGSFNEGLEEKVARIAPGSIIDAALGLFSGSGCEALFMSCTNLRTLDVIAPIENEIGVPVFSSNQVLAWHMARLAGVRAPAREFGKLFAE